MNGWELKMFRKNQLISQKLPGAGCCIQHTKNGMLAGRRLGTLGPTLRPTLGVQISLAVSKDIISQAAAGEKVIQVDK